MIKILRNMLITLTVVSVAVSTFALYLVFGYNENENVETVYKYYTEVYVGNDNPTISHIYKDVCTRFPETENVYCLTSFTKEVRQMNHLNGDTITYGELILVPYYSSEFH